MADPVDTNPELYSVLFENDRVRVLEYLDAPGDRTQPHHHPDSVMVTLGAFSRRLWSGDREVELDLPAFQARWLDAQEHSGMNIGETPTPLDLRRAEGTRAVDEPGRGTRPAN